MVTVDARRWDETVCGLTACQHPPCWETMWRIENGHPRISLKALGSPQRSSPDREEELPTLKIVDLPLNYSQRERIKRNESFASISNTISSVREARRYLSNSTLNETLIPPTSVLSSEKNPFPGLNSRMESHTPHFTTLSFHSWRPSAEKGADLGEFPAHGLDFPPACGNVVFQWVPDRRPRHLRPETSAPKVATSTERMCVKQLALEGILSCKDHPRTKTKKSNKVPTGGQPYLFHLKKNQPVAVSKANPGDKESRSSKENSGKPRMFSPCHLHLAPVTPLPREASQDRRSLPESKEAFLPSLTVQKPPGLDRFATKVSVKEKGSKSTPNQIKPSLTGLRLVRHLIPDLAEQLSRAGVEDSKAGGCSSKTRGLPLEASAGGWSPPVSPRRRKRSVKFVEYKSKTASLYVGGDQGCEDFVPRPSRTESKYTQYCQHLASRKEAAALPPREPPAAVQHRESWLEERAQTPEEAEDPLPQFPSPPGHPPPPPPSPLISEFSDHPSALELRGGVGSV